MGRLSALMLALVLGGASAVALVSCGGGSDAALLPGTTASQIESNLDQVDQLVAEDDCVGAEDAVAEVAAEVEGLKEVDGKLKAALQEGTARLSEVVSRCEEASEETEPALENDVEAEEEEPEDEKPKKEKPDKEAQEPSEQDEGKENEGPTLPPQSNGKGEEKGKGGGPPEPEAEETSPSGGVGPGVGVS